MHLARHLRMLLSYILCLLFRSHRPMSLVDVSGQNRTCLPSTPYNGGGEDLGPPWKVGFSETAGQRERCVSSVKREITRPEYSSLPRSFKKCTHITFDLLVLCTLFFKQRVLKNKLCCFNVYFKHNTKLKKI